MWSCCVEFFDASMLHSHHWHVLYRPLGWRGRMGFNQRAFWLASMAVHPVLLRAMMVLWEEAHERHCGSTPASETSCALWRRRRSRPGLG